MSSIESATAVTMSPSVLAQTMISGLSTDQNNLASLQQQISSGFAISTASDNPEGAANILQLNASLTRYTQYQSNAADALGWLQTGNSTVNTVLNVLHQVQSLAESVSGQQLGAGQAALSGIADQVDAALSQLQSIANTTYENGQPIFGGTGAQTQAYDSSGNYLGAGSPPTRTVAPGTQIAVAVTGPQVFGTGTTGVLSTTPGSLGVLAQMSADLRAGTTSSISQVEGADLTNLNNVISQAENAAATLGANQQSVEQFSAQATSNVSTLQQQLSSLQDVNMASAITNLQLQQTAYQAALYATSQLSTESLAKYL